MFSGLVEQTTSALEVKATDHLLKLTLKRPSSFKSLQEGESICVNGVCLTLESFDESKMLFSLAVETLKITKWTAEDLKNKTFNLEASLTLQKAVGGQLLTGHVDGLAEVKEIKEKGDSRILKVQVPRRFKDFFWSKGYIALNGVSLTINKVRGQTLELCLIPKTLELSNLSQIKVGELLNFEVDYASRAFVSGAKAFYKKLFWLVIPSVFFLFSALFFILFFVSSLISFF